MPAPLSMEIVDAAEQLYCTEGRTLKEIAARLGVCSRVLVRWSLKYGWKQKRLETRLALSEIRTKTLLLRVKLIEKSLESLSARDALAVASLESLAGRSAAKNADRPPSPPPKAAGKPVSLEDAVSALETACTARMQHLASDPAQLTSSAVRALKAAMEMVREFKSGDGDRSGGLTDEAADEIRAKILGIPRELLEAQKAEKAAKSDDEMTKKRRWSDY